MVMRGSAALFEEYFKVHQPVSLPWLTSADSDSRKEDGRNETASHGPKRS